MLEEVKELGGKSRLTKAQAALSHSVEEGRSESSSPKGSSPKKRSRPTEDAASYHKFTVSSYLLLIIFLCSI